MFCSNCGTEVNDDDFYCSNCGILLKDENEIEYLSEPVIEKRRVKYFIMIGVLVTFFIMGVSFGTYSFLKRNDNLVKNDKSKVTISKNLSFLTRLSFLLRKL